MRRTRPRWEAAMGSVLVVTLGTLFLVFVVMASLAFGA